MTSRPRSHRRTPRALPEAGAAPTEQIGGVVEALPDFPATPAVEQPRVMAELSGSMLADIRARNDAVDKARTEAIAAATEADHKRRMADYAQEALSSVVSRLVTSANLDAAFVYRVNIDSGRIEAAGPARGPRPV